MNIFEKFGQSFINKVINEAGVYIFYCDKNMNIAFSNQKAEDLLSLNSDSSIGKNINSHLYQYDKTNIKQQMFKAVLEDAVNFKRSNTFEGIISDSRNKQHFICWNITPISEDSNKIKGILLVGSDITDLKERENSFKRIDDNIKNIFNNIKEYALYVVNLEGNITYFGMAAEKMFGWGRQEIIFKHVSLLHTPEDARTKLNYMLEKAKLFGQCEEPEINLVSKKGENIPVMLTVSRFIDSDSNLTGFIFMAKDITERKKLEYQVFQSEKLAAIGQLVAGMAHEINNPLLVLSGRLEILSRERKLAKKIMSDLKVMSEQTDRIRNLIERLLRFTRPSPLKPELIAINDVIESVIPLISCQKRYDSIIKFERNYANDLRPIKADLNQLQEVFVNILINSCQAMPKGGRITLETKNINNSFAEIRIGDEGEGIPEKVYKNLFMPFFTTKRDGTGLGLSICYSIIKNHQGAIEVDTAEGKGTTFIIKLPFFNENEK